MTSEPPVVFYLDHTAKWSGGEIALLRTLEGLDKTRVTPVVVLAEDGPLADRCRAIGIETHVLPLDPALREVRRAELGGGGPAGKIKAVLRFAAYARQIARLARKRGARLLHCNSLKADIYGLIVGRLARVPVLWHVRDHIDPSYLPGPVVTIFRRLARSGPAYVLTNSDSTLGKLFPSGAPPNRASFVYDGLTDAELTSPPPTNEHFRNVPPRIGIVGRFVEWKGQHIFLDAARLLMERNREARYILIGAPLFGETDYETGLHRQADALGGRAEFTGFQKDVPGILRSLDILVHASTTPEPFGQVIIEGMAEGLPVIASDGGGAREIIENGNNGLLTPMNDAAALATALEGLLTDPQKTHRLARAGYDTVRARFTATHNARTIEAVYAKLGVISGNR